MSTQQTLADFPAVDPTELVKGREMLAYWEPNALFFEVIIVKVIKSRGIPVKAEVKWADWPSWEKSKVKIGLLRKLTEESRRISQEARTRQEREIASESTRKRAATKKDNQAPKKNRTDKVTDKSQAVADDKEPTNKLHGDKEKETDEGVDTLNNAKDDDDEPIHKKPRMDRFDAATEDKPCKPLYKKDEEVKEVKLGEGLENEAKTAMGKDKEMPIDEDTKERGQDKVQEAVLVAQELSPEAIAFIDNAWDESLSGEELLRPHGDNPVTRKDFLRLKGSNWLSDAIIDAYLRLLVDRSMEPSYPQVCAFSTFFYSKLKVNPAMASRWARRQDLFRTDYILIPVLLERQRHWCLVIVDMKEKKIGYFDSLSWGDVDKSLDLVLEFLSKEAEKRGVAFDRSQWTSTVHTDIPKQENQSDCGVFVCGFAECVTRRAQLAFTQADMPMLRKKMVWRIAANSVHA